jgi:putative MATE family efflux protein
MPETTETHPRGDAAKTPGAAQDAPDAAPALVAAPESPVSWWRILRESLRGSHMDFTTAPISQAIVMLAVPMVMEMFMESIFAVVDVFWVAHLGANAVATVGLSESMLTIVYTVAMGVSIGAMALVARRVGEKDYDSAARTAVQSIVLGLFIAAIIGVIGATYAKDLLRAMGATEEVIATGSGFTTVMLGGNVTVVLLFLINAVFRGAGDAAIAMRVLWLGNALNILLGPCFIFGLGPFPELGVMGAAVATNIGRGTAVLFQLSLLARGRGRVVIHRRHLGLDFSMMASVLRLSGASTLQILINTSSYIGIVRIISSFGSVALAGYTIGIRIIIFALLPSFGMSNAAATLVGQNLGAGHPERAEQAVWKACFYNAIFLGSIGLAFIVFAPALIGIFTQDPAVQPYAIDCLRIVSLGFLFYAYGMVLTQSFNGAGDTLTPTYLNLGIFWALEIPLAWVLAHYTPLGPRGVFAALAIAFSMLAIVAAFLFKRGAWKLKKV